MSVIPQSAATALPDHLWQAPSPDFYDPVIEAYKRDVDRTLLRANLRLSVAQRFEQFDNFGLFAQELHAAGERHRESLRANRSASE